MATLLHNVRVPRVLQRGRHAQRRVRRPPQGRLGPALVAIAAALLIGPVALAGSSDRPGHGLLSVTTEPTVESGISVDGTLRNTGELQGLELPAGDHEVCFAPAEGYLSPECMIVSVGDGGHTTATGTFLPAGTVVIVAEPAGLAPTVTVDGVERDRGATTLTLPAGEHEICWSEESGHTTPDCQEVVVEAFRTMTLVGTYEQSATTPSDHGTSPDGETTRPTPDSPTAENLLTDAQHTFNTSEVGWVAQGNTIVAQTDAAPFDDAGALVVRVSASGAWPDDSRTARVGTSPGRQDGVPVRAAADHSGSARVLSLDGAADARCELRWYGAAGKQQIIRTDAGPMTSVAEREWTILQCGAVAPADAVAGSLRILFDGVDYGRSFLVDDARFVQGTLDDSSPPPEPMEEPTTEPAPAPGPEPTGEPTSEPMQEPISEPTIEAPASDPVAATASSFPNASNTGVVDESSLRPSGTVSSSHDGQVIENLEVSGAIQIQHDNVTVRNVRVLGTAAYGIHVPPSLHTEVTGLLIEDVEIAGVSGDRSAGLVHYGEWTARRVDVHGYNDAVKMGGGQVLEDSYLHGLYKTPTSHNDGIQIQSGSGSVIRGNSIVNDFSQTSALMLQTNFGPIDDWLVEGNRFSGGGFTVYITDKGNGYGPPTNVTMRGNVWVRDSWHWGPLRTKNLSSSAVWDANTYDDGTPFEPR